MIDSIKLQWVQVQRQDPTRPLLIKPPKTLSSGSTAWELTSWLLEDTSVRRMQKERPQLPWNVKFVTFRPTGAYIWCVIGGFGLGISTFLAFGYMYFLRIPGLLFLLTWGCILAVLVLLVISASLVLSLASSWKAEGTCMVIGIYMVSSHCAVHQLCRGTPHVRGRCNAGLRGNHFRGRISLFLCMYLHAQANHAGHWYHQASSEGFDRATHSSSPSCRASYRNHHLLGTLDLLCDLSCFLRWSLYFEKHRATSR